MKMNSSSLIQAVLSSQEAPSANKTTQIMIYSR